LLNIKAALMLLYGSECCTLTDKPEKTNKNSTNEISATYIRAQKIQTNSES
jgi:hypothetical protein